MEVFGWDLPLWWVFGLATLYAAYKYSTSTFGFFENSLGIKGPRPYPLVGTMIPVFTKGISVHDREMIAKYGKVVSLWMGRQPVLLVSDLDIIKQILVKEFQSFVDRTKDIEVGPPGDKMLTMLKGEHWKHVRGLVSPTFSSGKLRGMTEAIKNCTEAFVKNLSSQGTQAVDVRQYTGAFTMDVIASTAFGLDIDSQSDPQNQFVKMASVVVDASIWRPRIMIMVFLPFLNKLLCRMGFGTMDSSALKFFSSIVERAIEERKKEEDVQRNDFLQLMINARETEQSEDGVVKSKKSLTKEEVLAQSFLFFMAGYDTIKNSLTFLMYSLAQNQDVQEKARQEIADNTKNGPISYDILSKLTYLEMVINETLRMYAPVARADRLCVEGITIKGVYFPKDVVASIPVDYLHYDPIVWPDPKTFNPERFTEAAKAARNPYYYMPFGLGPRNCVGMRLAIMEIKMAIAAILPKLKIVTTPETKIPIDRDKLTCKPGECKLRFEKIAETDGK